MKRLIFDLSLAGLLAAGPTFGEVNPVPVWPCSEKDAGKAAEALTKGELACTFDVKFGSLPSGGSVDGLFTLTADKDGVLTLELPAAPTAMEGDVRLFSSDKVTKGAWHRVSFNYSILMHRVAFYVDGKLQFENDNIFIPELEFAAPTAGGFNGEVKNLKVYDIALTTDYLFRGKNVAAKAHKASALAVAAGAKNPALADWAKRIAARAAAVDGETTVKEIDEICRDAANVERLSVEKAYGPVTFHQVKPYEQEMFLPYVLPKQGVNDGTLKAYAAGGQEEDASFVVTALKGIKDFTVRASDLIGAGGARISAKDIDVKHVNRWFRAGGAWVSYFLDVRQRILTPHLLLNDDELIRADELRTRHYFRTNYPEGPKWVDGSDPKKGHQMMKTTVPFRDAATLQPTKQLWEAGRNHQYFMSIWVPRGQKAGLYKGTLDLVADNVKVGTVSVELKVLPFDLPLQACCYDDPTRPYFTHMNSFPNTRGYTYAEQIEHTRAEMRNVVRHGMHYCSDLWRGPAWAKLALEEGFQTDYIFDVPCPDNWSTYYNGVKASELTDADRELGLRFVTRKFLPFDRFIRSFAPNCTPMAIAYSEAGAYAQLNADQAERAEAAHRLGWKMFAHGGDANLNYAADIQDNNSDVSVKRETAERWHAAGGTVMAYAQPFASPENPAVHRRRLGFERWLGAHYDGNMQHGFDVRDIGYNEFAVDPDGDGNYRCVEMAYHDQYGLLYGIPWSGVKAAHDDLRYATLMKQLAEKHLKDADGDLRGEAKRQLAWLARQDGWNCDMPMMRAALADRIVTMLAMEQKKGGK